MTTAEELQSTYSPEAASIMPVLISPYRAIGEIVANVTVEEQHLDELRITDHPIETGAAISDHAFKEAARVTLTCGWSNSGLWANGDPEYVRNVYDALLRLQEAREPFTIYTGKRDYPQMLIESLALTTAQDTENAMLCVVRCKQVIIVETQVVTITNNPATQAAPEKTAPSADTGTKQPVETPTLTAPQAGMFMG